MERSKTSTPRSCAFITVGMNLKPLAFAFLCAATPVAADYDPSQYPAYETCALCHGLFGVSHTAKFPHLGGQKPAYIEAQLRAFLSGFRTNDGGQMSAIVTELQPEDCLLYTSPSPRDS